MASNTIGRTIATAGALLAATAVGYAIYFDYKRRNSHEFRRELKKRSRLQKIHESRAQEEAKQKRLQEVTEFLAAELAKDPVPSDPAKKETVFTSNVELGERLAMTPGKELEAAAKFYKALTVYPSPADLLGIYQRSIPENIYENVVLMIAIMPPANVSSFLGSATSSTEAKEAMAAANTIDE